MQQNNNQNIDIELIVSVQQGNKEAFDVLMSKYQHRILRLINRYIKDTDEALDLMQDVFIKAYRAVYNFRKDSTFFTWLYKIAINTIKTYLMDKKKHNLNFSLDDVNNKIQYQDVNNPDVDNLILYGELEDIFFATIDNLPGKLKTAIELREIHDKSYEEIAAIMACPVGTVRSRIFRAREAIEKKVINNKKNKV